MKEAVNPLLLAVLAALILTGCGKAPEAAPSSQPTPASPPSTPTPQQPAAQQPAAQEPATKPAANPAGDPDKNLNLFCWSEYVPQEVIDAFTKETGIKVSVENYASNEEMLAKLLAGGGT